MKTRFVKTATALALAAGAFGAQAAVLTFDDLSGPTDWFTTTYNGLNFGYGWYHSPVYDLYQQPVTGTWIGVGWDNGVFPAWGTVGDLPAVSSLTAFNLASVYLSGAEITAGSPLQLTFTLYNGATLVDTEMFTLNSDGTTKKFTFAYGSPITSFVINGPRGAFALDNLDVTAVPEPSSYLMMAAGLAFVVGAAARRKTA